MTAPALKAMESPWARPWLAACDVRNIGADRNKHADEARGARKDRADQEPDGNREERRKARSTKITPPAMAMVVYWRVR